MTEENKKCKCVKCDNCKDKKRRGGPLFIGMWLLFFGVFFLAVNFGVFAYADFSKIWPIFLIIPGIIFMMRGLSNNNN